MGGDRIPGPLNDAVDEETRRRREFAERHLGGEENERMGFEAYDRAEKEYQADIVRLDKIAFCVVDSDRASFVRAFAQTWIEAIPPDKRILRLAWASIVTKYALEKVTY